MEQRFVGLDVSQAETAVCVVDAAGLVLWQGKRVLGGGLRSRGLDAQRAEAAIAARALNRMVDLGMPRAQRVA